MAKKATTPKSRKSRSAKKTASSRKNIAIAQPAAWEANIGNKWWQKRSTHGREKIFESPNTLWEACCEYFEFTDSRKWVKEDFIKGGDNAGNYVYLNTDTPFTIEGLCVFLRIDVRTWYNYRTQESYKEFFPVVAHVDQIIRTKKLEGAMVGAYDGNIVAMDLGMKQKIEAEVDSGEGIASIFDKLFPRK